MSRKILITGVGGQLGKALQQNLMDKFDVIATTRFARTLDYKSDIKILDITHRREVEKIINETHPDIIINCASYTDVDGCETNKSHAHLVNVTGLQNLIHASDHDTYFIQISSDYVFDGDAGPYLEEDHTFPINYYGKTKLEAENNLRGSQRKSLIIRSNVLYSEDLLRKSNFFSWVYKSLRNNQRISVVNDQVSNPTYISHLVQAIFQCIILNAEGIYHYGSDDYLSRYEFAIAIAKYFKMDANLITSINTQDLHQNIPSYVAKRPRHSGLNTLKIENEVGITTYSTEYSLNILNKILVYT